MRLYLRLYLPLPLPLPNYRYYYPYPASILPLTLPTPFTTLGKPFLPSQIFTALSTQRSGFSLSPSPTPACLAEAGLHADPDP